MVAVAGRLEGASVLITGSATSNGDASAIRLAHAVVREIVRALLSAGAGIVVLASGEPTAGDPPIPLIFDWTVLREIDVWTKDSGSVRPGRITIVTSEKARTGKFSSEQRDLLARLVASGANIVQVPDETYTGGNIVDREVEVATALIAIGGTKGVVDRALKIAAKGGVVLPLDIDLGYGQREGALRLRAMLLEHPQRFLPGLGDRAVSQLATASLLVSVPDPSAIARRAVDILADDYLANPSRSSDCLVITALPVEWRAVAAVLGIPHDAPPARTTASGTALWSASLPSARRPGGVIRVDVACISASGNVAMAAAVGELLDARRPKALLLTGIAAGRRESLPLGTVVIAERVVGYESAAVAEASGEPYMQPRADTYQIPHVFRQDLIGYLQSPDSLSARLQACLLALGAIGATPASSAIDMLPRFATVASGEKLLRSAVAFDDLRSVHGKIEVAEMEAVGVAVACGRTSTPFLVVRGISDHGDATKDDRFHVIAAHAAAVVAVDVLREALTLE